MDSLVAIAEFTDTASAHLARNFLESEGIPAFLQDENLVGINWSYSLAVGGVRLQVLRQDAERAAAFLKDNAPSPPTLEDWAAALGEDPKDAGFAACVAPAACSRCGSADIKPCVGHSLGALLSLLLVLICAPPTPKYLRCRGCGHEWKY